jgi:regulator of sigma E protease
VALSILGFLAVLAPLVIIHEFGHYLFARLFNVKAEVFSIGFGPVVWNRKIGETDWRVSAVPLGGYVKLMGEEPGVELSPEDLPRALGRQAPWKRFLIFFGGPLFNFIWAVVVFMAILAIGEPQVASRIGRVVENSAAAKAGFQSGDLIEAVNSKPVRRFEEVLTTIQDLAGKPVEFQVLRDHFQAGSKRSEKLTLTAVPSEQQGFSVYGETMNVGEIEGLISVPRNPTLGISNPKSIAGSLGLKTGDKITKIDGNAIANWEEIERSYQSLPNGKTFELELQAYQDSQSRTVTLKKPVKSESLGKDLGVYSLEMFIERTLPDSPIEKAGALPGDRILAVGDQPVTSFMELKDAVQRAGEKHGEVRLTLERQGELMQVSMTPTQTQTRDMLLKKITIYTVGVPAPAAWGAPEMIIERVWNPFTLLYRATERMVIFSWRNLVSIQKMFTGDVSISQLGGPILIGKIAGDSLARGLVDFLKTMAILSVGLGVLNLFPVPVLDGGQILLLGIETIRRKPLAMRQMEIIQQVGLALILVLMIVVMRNDLARLPIFN